MKFIKSFAPAALLFLTFALILGVLYPAAVSGMAAVKNLVHKEGPLGQLAQPFSGQQYFWGRIDLPELEAFKDAEGRPLYYARPANLSPTSEVYQKLVAERRARLEAADPKASKDIPQDLLTVSGSGLDPDISPAAAAYQAPRVAAARGLDLAKVEALIKANTTGRFLGLFGEPRVNVPRLNAALDKLQR